METKTRKTTMIGAALAVAIIALAGAGYAIAYTATTDNSGNTMDATYLTLTQTGDAAYNADFLKDIYFNSVTEGSNDGTSITETTTYTPVYDYAADYTTTGTKTLALISNPMTLNVAPVNSGAQSVTLKVTVEHFTKVTGLTYTMVLTNGSNTPVAVAYGASTSNPNSWYFESLALNQTTGTSPQADTTVWTVQLFVSGSADTPSTGFPASNVADADKAVFTFEMTATA